MKNSVNFFWAGLIMLSLFPYPLCAAVYQWTDEHGRVHFSDRPTHERAKEVETRSHPATPRSMNIPEERRAKRQRMLDVYSEERAEKKERANKAKQAREERKQKCITARTRYEKYTRANRLYDRLENGERQYLDQSQRNQFIAELKTDVDHYCQ